MSDDHIQGQIARDQYAMTDEREHKCPMSKADTEISKAIAECGPARVKAVLLAAGGPDLPEFPRHILWQAVNLIAAVDAYRRKISP